MKRLAVPCVVILSIVLVGCSSGSSGIPQVEYDRVNAQLSESQARITELQRELQIQISEPVEQSDTVDVEIKAAEAKIAELQNQIINLKDQYELVGGTPAETAENIIEYYHQTHVYSTWDMFVCSDMSSEVWNMLKAQGINGIVVIGNVDVAVGDILQSDHAWVMAEVVSGEYLALETTAGYVVPKHQNPLYYRGWFFDNPAKIKDNNQLVWEYNTRVAIHNQIVDEDRKVVEEHNRATSQNTADKLEAVHDKLSGLVKAQQAELSKIKTQIDGLATELR